MSNVRLAEVLKVAGLDELQGITQDALAQDFMPASVVGLSDGDIVGVHEQYADPFMVEMYGEHLYNEGKVAANMLAAALKNRREPGDMYGFQRFVASYLIGSPLLPDSTAATRVYPYALVVDGNPVPLARSPEMITDYGACLSSRSIITDQINFARQGARPFSYMPISRLPFVNQTLGLVYDQLLGQGGKDTAIDKKIFVGLEDGVANGTNEMIEAQRAHSAPADIMDVVLCNSSDHMSPEDLKGGIENAHTILKDDGIFVLRLSDDHTGEGASTPPEEALQWALDAGFAASKVFRYETESSHNLGRSLLTGRIVMHSMQTRILTK